MKPRPPAKVTRSSGPCHLRLGDPSSAPVPEPLAGLLLELVKARANMNTASNPDTWPCQIDLTPAGRFESAPRPAEESESVRRFA
jgi:hypothetical protein